MNNPWSRDGFYLIPPSARNLLDCQFYSSFSPPTLSQLQGWVGGWIELVRVPFAADAWVNEEGKLQGLPINPLATELYANPNDVICGTMVVCCGKTRESEADD